MSLVYLKTVSFGFEYGLDYSRKIQHKDDVHVRLIKAICTHDTITSILIKNIDLVDVPDDDIRIGFAMAHSLFKRNPVYNLKIYDIPRAHRQYFESSVMQDPRYIGNFTVMIIETMSPSSMEDVSLNRVCFRNRMMLGKVVHDIVSGQLPTTQISKIMFEIMLSHPLLRQAVSDSIESTLDVDQVIAPFKRYLKYNSRDLFQNYIGQNNVLNDLPDDCWYHLKTFFSLADIKLMVDDIPPPLYPSDSDEDNEAQSILVSEASKKRKFRLENAIIYNRLPFHHCNEDMDSMDSILDEEDDIDEEVYREIEAETDEENEEEDRANEEENDVGVQVQVQMCDKR